MLVKMISWIKIDPETIIQETAREYDTPIGELTMEDVNEYLSNNLSYAHQRRSSTKWCVEDGPSSDGLEEVSYEQMEKILQTMQDKFPK